LRNHPEEFPPSDEDFKWVRPGTQLLRVRAPALLTEFFSQVLEKKMGRDKGIEKAVFEHGYTQREVANHLRIHFTSVSRILRAKDEMLKK